MRELKKCINREVIKIKIPKIETKLQVKNHINNISELYLYGTIRKAYSWEDEEACISAKRVKDTLVSLSGREINIHINSSGGDVFESIAIHNLLKQHNSNINVYVDALAASGAGIIAMAGDKIFMPRNAMMMLHKAWTYAEGNSDDLRKLANDLEKMDEAVLENYKEKFIGTEEELISLVKESTWLTAVECKALGLCDEILNEIEEPKEENIKNSILNKYMNKVEEPYQETKNINENIKIIKNFLKQVGGL